MIFSYLQNSFLSNFGDEKVFYTLGSNLEEIKTQSSQILQKYLNGLQKKNLNLILGVTHAGPGFVCIGSQKSNFKNFYRTTEQHYSITY